MKLNILKLVTLSIVAIGVIGLCQHNSAQAATDAASLDTTVSTTLTLGVSPGSISLGNLIPGTPVVGASGVVITVNTSADSGYLLGVSDGVTGSDSALLHTDTTTRIADYAGTIAIPTTWTGTGLGFTVYAADTNKEAKWGTGTTYNDANNNYAGVPETTTTFHSSPGFKAVDDTTSVGFKVDVPNSQKTGNYSGNVTITATAVVA